MTLEAYLRKADEYSKNADAMNTRRTYASQTRMYERWCAKQGIAPYPLTEEQAAAYLVARADEVAPTSVRLCKAVLTSINPELRSSPLLHRLMRGIGRTRRRIPRGATGLTYEGWLKIRALDTPRPKSSLGILWRDIALVGVMRDLMLRRSEAVALQWGDVAYQQDGTALVTIRYSKTDPEGLGAVRHLGEMATEDLKRWQREQPGHAHYLDVRRVFGLTRDRTVCQIIEGIARQAGLEGAYSGHSPRIGMAEDLAQTPGVTMTGIQFAGRWADSKMPAYYTRNMDARNGPVARLHKFRTSSPTSGAPV